MSVDLCTKYFLNESNMYANVFNACVFDGDELITNEHLAERNGEEIIIRGDDYEHRYRDLLKIWKTDGEVDYLLLGVESQTSVDKGMPIRVANYDIIELIKQYEQGRDKIIPVITVVIYFSPDKWTGPRSLKEIYHIKDERILRKVMNYELNLIEPYALTEEELCRFNDDLQAVFRCIKYSKDKKLLEEYLQSVKIISNKSLNVLRETIGLDIEIDEESEGTNVCIALDEIRKDSEMKGEIRGEMKNTAKWISVLQSLGISFEMVVDSITKQLGLSYEEAEALTRKNWKFD